MATASFTKDFILSKKAAEILAEDLSSDEKAEIKITKNFVFYDEKFIENALCSKRE